MLFFLRRTLPFTNHGRLMAACLALLSYFLPSSSTILALLHAHVIPFILTFSHTHSPTLPYLWRTTEALPFFFLFPLPPFFWSLLILCYMLMHTSTPSVLCSFPRFHTCALFIPNTPVILISPALPGLLCPPLLWPPFNHV